MVGSVRLHIITVGTLLLFCITFVLIDVAPYFTERDNYIFTVKACGGRSTLLDLSINDIFLPLGFYST